MSAVLSVQRFGNPAGQPAIFSKMEMQLSPFLDATFWNYCLQKTTKGNQEENERNPIVKTPSSIPETLRRSLSWKYFVVVLRREIV